MSPASVSALLDVLDIVRDEIAVSSPCSGGLSESHFAQISSALATANSTWARSLEEQLIQYRTAPYLRRNVFFGSEPPCIFAAFLSGTDCDSKVNFEFAHFDRLDAKTEIASHITSNATPVWLHRTSEGLKSNRIVALFPENWQFNASRPPNCDDAVLYFINRFVNRFFNYSLNALENMTSETTFARLKRIRHDGNATDIIRDLSVNWMWMHEHCHHLGCLPLPHFLNFKNTRSAGAVEEMRADVLAILVLSDAAWLKSEEQILLIEFILSERLLRYPIECIKNRAPLNYDAIGSQILLHFLMDCGSIALAEGKLSLSDNWLLGLRRYSCEIDNLERRASLGTAADARRSFGDFARYWGGYDFQTKTFVADSFYSKFI